MNLNRETIRQQKMAVSDPAVAERLLLTSRTGFLGLSDGPDPYVVPLNYVWLGGAVYFHGASDGRKARLMQTPRSATFTVCDERGTISNPVPAKTDTAYLSVMVFGAVSRLPHGEEAVSAMQGLLDKYVPGYFEAPLQGDHLAKYVSSSGSRTAVYRLSADLVTAKESPSVFEQMFYPGRTRAKDLERG